MKTLLPIITVTALALLAGCSRTEQTGDSQQSEAPVTAQAVTDSYKDAAATTKEYVAENKDAFVAAMDKRLNELDTKIAELAKKAESYTDDTKVQADKTVANLREQREKMKIKFDELKSSSADAWKDVKAGFASAMDELEKVYDNAKSEFN